jgi:hypothetical protein
VSRSVAMTGEMMLEMMMCSSVEMSRSDESECAEKWVDSSLLWRH